MHRVLKYWLPVVLWLVLMFVGSTDLMSSEHTSRFLVPFLRWLVPDISEAALFSIQLFVRKCAHVAEYTVLAALFFRAFREGRHSFWRAAVPTLISGIAFAAFDEFHQSFVPSRTGMAGDVVVDSIGVVIALFLVRMWMQRQKRGGAACR